DLCLELAAHGLIAVGKANTHEEGRTQADHLLQSGAAARKFAKIIATQGGPSGEWETLTAALPVAPHQIPVKAQASGVVAAMEAEAVGRLAMAMGGGRAAKSDVIDPAVGIVLHRKTGDGVQPETELAALHLRASDLARSEEFASALHAAYTF